VVNWLRFGSGPSRPILRHVRCRLGCVSFSRYHDDFAQEISPLFSTAGRSHVGPIVTARRGEEHLGPISSGLLTATTKNILTCRLLLATEQPEDGLPAATENSIWAIFTAANTKCSCLPFDRAQVCWFEFCLHFGPPDAWHSAMEVQRALAAEALSLTGRKVASRISPTARIKNHMLHGHHRFTHCYLGLLRAGRPSIELTEADLVQACPCSSVRPAAANPPC